MEARLKVALFLLFIFETGYGSEKLPLRKEYDYVVVGAGSSGATVASRLSEDNWATVLLLEAGGQPLPATEIPYLVGTLQNTAQDWSYYTEPQEYACQGLEEKRSFWPRGKALGGTSSLNYMIYARGNKRDYDRWAAEGCTGWGYDDVLPFFKKSEDNRIPGTSGNGYHGVGGNLTVSYANYETPLRRALIEAGKELGYEEVDYNGENQTGFSPMQGTLRDGARCSTEKAFLRVPRPNLDIVDGAFVIKIAFDEEKRAHSVIFEKDNFTHTVEAGKEIVISAGSINTPQLLMVSGVGPKEHLQEMGIPVVADLPGVGANLQDHIATGGLNYRINQPISFLPSRVATDENFKLFATEGRGPLTVAGAIEVVAFIHTKYGQVDYPDIQLLLINTAVPIPNISKKVMQDYKIIFQEEEILTVGPQLLRPNSRGFIKLRSPDPHVHPIIDPRYYTEENDLKIMMEGIRIAHNFTKTKSLQDLGAEIMPGVMPGCEEYNLWSDDYVACLARTLTFTIYHPVGTCKMGDPNDPMTVLDPELRVKGVTGLRVADASVMPYLISGNTNAVCIMIGEKLADMIKQNEI